MWPKGVAAVLIGGLVASALPAWATDPITVRSTRAGEYRPVAGDGFLGWAQNSRRRPNHFDAVVKPDGEASFQVNSSHTQGSMGGIDGTTLVYQQRRGSSRVFIEEGQGRSDIKFYDLGARQRSDPPSGVNTSAWEYWPSLSGDWLLFGRIGRGKTKIILLNLADDSTRILMTQASNRRVLPSPGQVSGDYAVWDACNRRFTSCNVYMHQISTSTTSKIPKPDGVEWQDFPSVAVDGTVYFERTGSSCRSRSKLVRYPLGGPATVLARSARGWGTTGTFVYLNGKGEREVFFDRYNACGPGQGDIYKVLD